MYSLECYACKGCAFYAAGAIAPTSTCVTIGTNRTGCSPLGCNYCYDAAGQPQNSMQVYRTLPAGAAFAPAPPPPPGAPRCAAYTASGGSFASVCTLSGVPAGATIRAGTTGMTGAACSGDTLLKLANSAGSVVAQNDDANGGVCSLFAYTVTTAGTYTIQQGCWSGTTCGGTVAYTF